MERGMSQGKKEGRILPDPQSDYHWDPRLLTNPGKNYVTSKTSTFSPEIEDYSPVVVFRHLRPARIKCHMRCIDKVFPIQFNPCKFVLKGPLGEMHPFK